MRPILVMEVAIRLELVDGAVVAIAALEMEQHGAVSIGIGHHGAEFVEREGVAAEAEAGLAVDDGAAGREEDGEGDEEEDGRQEDKGERRKG